MLHASTVLNAAKIVLDRAEKLKIGNPPDDTLIDFTKLSTPLLQMLQAELRQIEQRESQGRGASRTLYWNSRNASILASGGKSSRRRLIALGSSTSLGRRHLEFVTASR
jgi:hypothetical protein